MATDEQGGDLGPPLSATEMGKFKHKNLTGDVWRVRLIHAAFHFKSPISYFKFQISHFKSQISNLKFAILVLLLCACGFASTAASLQKSDVERKIDALLKQMTLEEKLGQLQILDGEANGNYRPEHLEMIRKGLLGSTLNVRGAKRTNELQRLAVEQSRLKIPMLFGFDVIHGYRTIFPISLGEAASWDPLTAE